MSAGLTKPTAGALTLTGKDLRLADVVAVARGCRRVRLSEPAWAQVAIGRDHVDSIVARDQLAYGITTGVGSQKNYRIRPAEAGGYSARLVRAHGSRGPGPLASPAVLRGALTIQLNALAHGVSGVRATTVAALIAWLEADDWPEIRLGHSIGAGDLLSLGQLASAFLDREARRQADGITAAVTDLAAKEGLTFLNSNCLTLAQGALVLADTTQLLSGLNRAAALSLEGLRGNPQAWADRVERIHPQPGQVTAGRALRALLADSRLWQPGAPRFLQDPLSLRCVPQIHGACYGALAWANTTWETEINSVVDNPSIDLASGEPFSHGNMETTMLSVTLDALRLALAKAIEAAGERLHKIQWPAFSGLPIGLADEGGATGGVQFLSIAHLAAAEVAAARLAATPVTLQYRGQICDGVEDIGGLAPLAVAECERLLAAAWTVAAVEAAVGAWAIARRELAVEDLGVGLRRLYPRIRALLPIGHEGEQRFDLEPIIDVLKTAEVTA